MPRQCVPPNSKAKKAEQLREILATPGRYVAVTGEERRIEYLIDRNLVLEQVAQKDSAETTN